MAENTKLGFDHSDALGYFSEVGELGEMVTEKISISDQRNSFQDRSETSDSFIVNMESLSRGTDKDIKANSRINLQRSLSRKGSQRGGQRNTASAVTETDTMAAASASSRGAALIGVCTPNSPVTVPVVVVGSTDPINPQGQQVRMTMTTTTTAVTNTAESKYTIKSAGRRSRSWLLDPRRIVLFFATLSSMGTIILIYFTLSINKLNGEKNSQSEYW